MHTSCQCSSAWLEQLICNQQVVSPNLAIGFVLIYKLLGIDLAKRLLDVLEGWNYTKYDELGSSVLRHDLDEENDKI